MRIFISSEVNVGSKPDRADDLFRDLAGLYRAAAALHKQPSAASKADIARTESALKLYSVLAESAVQFGWLDSAEKLMLDERQHVIRSLIELAYCQIDP